MEEWKEYRLGDVVRLINGRAYLQHELFDDGKYRIVRVGNLSGGDRWFYSNMELSEEKYCEKGDLLYAWACNFGPYIWKGDKTIYHYHIWKLVEDDAVVDKLFLFYYLKYLTPYWLGNVNGSVMVHITKGTMEKFLISLPPLITQRRIAAILKSLDDKIEVNRRINDNLEQQAQALFKSWLNLCDKEVTLGDLSLNITDYTKCDCEKVVLVNSSDVFEGSFEHHNLSDNKNLKGHFKKRFQKGDILYSQVRPRNRHWAYCTFDANNYLASTQLMIIRNKQGIIPGILLYQYIIDNRVWMDFTNMTETRSGTFPQGNYEELSSIKVPFGANMDIISIELERLYSLKYNIEDESRRLSSLRDTLLPRLMSGELKINDISV